MHHYTCARVRVKLTIRTNRTFPTGAVMAEKSPQVNLAVTQICGNAEHLCILTRSLAGKGALRD